MQNIHPMTTNKTGSYQIHQFEMKPDYEGPVICTLIERKTKEKSSKAFLYLHGFNDYFFDDNLADWANEKGMNFYALELRKYGRSILPHQKPNDFRDYHEYFEDIDKAIDFIRNEDKNQHIVFMGHSTGGLLAALYGHHHCKDKTLDTIILNSPFFEFNLPSILKATFVPLMTALGKRFPGIPSPVGLDKGYGYSLHKNYEGEWNYDLKLKPIEGFKIHASWIRGIQRAQAEVQKGLNIPCPVLVMYSATSVSPGNFKPEMKHADSVLNVEDIEHYAHGLGNNVEHAVFEGGLHDLLLSEKPVREGVMHDMALFIEKTLH